LGWVFRHRVCVVGGKLSVQRGFVLCGFHDFINGNGFPFLGYIQIEIKDAGLCRRGKESGDPIIRQKDVIGSDKRKDVAASGWAREFLLHKKELIKKSINAVSDRKDGQS
jgi:hypothetical protein